MTRRLLWIGDREHPEFEEAWRWANHREPCHYRSSIDDALNEPAKRISRILIPRSSRTPQPTQALAALNRQYPLATIANLNGSLCEGESRTGNPWKRCLAIAWHRWAYQLPNWCDENRRDPTLGGEQWIDRSASFVVVVRAQSNQCDGLIDSLRSANVRVAAVSPEQLQLAGPCTDLFCDDSVIRSDTDWESLRARFAGLLDQQGTRCHWLVSGPTYDRWRALRRGGFNFLHSKPFDLPAILRSLHGDLAECSINGK
ncbi:MAG: hypothetical protein R3C05_25570 [Pirellulaceae bacterium]